MSMVPRSNCISPLLVGLFIGALAGAAAFELGLSDACPTRACVDSSEVLPVTDRAYFAVAHRIISEAEGSVHIVAYELNYYPRYPNSSQSLLIRDLIYARQRGLDVRIYADENAADGGALEILRANGILVRLDGNGTVTHAKVIVVDGRRVLLGSTNLSFSGLERNNEANVLLDDKRTAQYFENYFLGLWGG